MNQAELDNMARTLRIDALKMVYYAQSGHPGGSLSGADIVTALFFDIMNFNKNNYKFPERDRFVLSKGHACPILYAALIEKRIVPRQAIKTLRREGSMLQGHPDMNKCPGVEISTGSLGQGFSASVGMAIGLKMSHSNSMVYTLLGDGECDEGLVWEAAQAANKYQLDHLMIFIDHNNLQNDGTSDEIMPTMNMRDKFQSFGFETEEIDGHDISQIIDTVVNLKQHHNGKPKCIVCRTTKGKGVSFMENVVAWHGKAPNDDEMSIAMKELGGILNE